MSRRSRFAIPTALVAAAILASGACDPVAVDEPGTVEVVLTAADWTAADTLVAAYITVDGPAVNALRAARAYEGFTRAVSGTESSIVILGPFAEPGVIASFDVPDVNSIGTYTVTLVQAATLDLALVPTGNYAVRLRSEP